MSNTNLSVVRLEGSEYRIHKLLKDLNGRATVIVRGSRGILYVGLPSQELGWLDKVIKDIGCKKQELPSLPEHEAALCGVLVINRRYHEGRCKACAVLRVQKPPVTKQPRKPRASKAIVVAKIEPGQNFDLNGVIASIEITHDRLFAQLDSLETLMTNLKAYRDAKDQLSGLEQEAKDRMGAARKLLNEDVRWP